MDSTFDYDLVCIGSGPAGQRAAVQAAKLGQRAAVVEKARCVGGVCVDTGTIPSKTLREAVIFLTGTGGVMDPRRRIRTEGRPTAEQLLSRVEEVVTRERTVIEDQLQRNDVTLLQGEASFVDPHRLQIVGDRTHTVSAARIVIAVGTRPAAPPGVPADGEVVLTSDDVTTLKKLPRTLAVVGAGVIGVEYASMFAALGVSVTLIERRERPLEFLDREIVDELLHQMRSRNVTFRLGEAVASIAVESSPTPRAVLLLESGKRIVSDVVLFSAGRVSATDRLNLGAAGLLADERGRLKVDETFCTTVPHIFAAGDVIGYPSLAATSSEQGRLAACHAFGVEAGPMISRAPS